MKDLTFIRFAALALLAIFSAAEFNPTKVQYCFEACLEALAEQTYAGSPTAEDGFYLEICENALHVQSNFLCVRAYCTHEEARQGYEFESSNCKENGASLPSMSVVGNVTAEDIQSMQTLEYGVTPEIINATIIPSRDHYQLALRTTVSFVKFSLLS